jgi:hypothetical protein
MTIAFECELKIIGEEMLRWLQNKMRGEEEKFCSRLSISII